MKIVSLVAENVKKLRAVEITPRGEIVDITGKNKQGKTSVLDSIWLALDHTRVTGDMPIRKGQNKARIRLDLGEIVVERRFSSGGTTSLSVESADGARYRSPQGVLDALLGELSFDPLAFARMEPRKQFDELRRIAKLSVDVDKLDGQNASEYAKRTDVNREVKQKRAQAEAILLHPDLPEEPLDEPALIDQIEKASRTNVEIETRKAKRESAARDAVDKRADSQRLIDRAEQLRKEAEELTKAATALQDEAHALDKKLAEAEPLPEPVDVSAVRKLLDDAKQVNSKIAARNRRREIEAEVAALEKAAQALTESMEAREKAKAEAIQQAQMPVPGLGFGAGVVMYNEIPFDQASSAEQLQVSLSIAMAANPKLRVIRIQDGSLLDEDSLAQIAEMAKDKDYQIWVERVDSSGKIGIYIEDGSVVSVDGEPVPPPATAEPAKESGSLI